MKTDCTGHIAEFWPAIMEAWHAHADKRPVIECDVVKRQVLAWSSQEYIDSLSPRTRETTRRQFQRAMAAGGILIFVRDSQRRILQSQVHVPAGPQKRRPRA